MTSTIHIGNVAIGGGARVSVQTMTNTDTGDVAATVAQIREVMEAGCDIVRLAVPDAAAAKALPEIRRQTEGVPLVADVHFDYRLAVAAANAGFDALRINPGNIGGEERIREVVKAAAGRPIRIGVNGGSLEKDILEKYGSPTAEALVESALRHVTLLERAGHEVIKISVKASDVQRTVAAYRLLAQQTHYPLHLGVTEAGTFLAGTVRSSLGIGILLSEGIGDTIRVSLTDTPVQEVKVGLEIVRSLGLRPPGVSVTSCPTCGRTKVNVVETAQRVEAMLETYYRENPATPRRHVAVMGCVVNGPGEAREADIALIGKVGAFDLLVHGKTVATVTVAEAPEALRRLLHDLHSPVAYSVSL